MKKLLARALMLLMTFGFVSAAAMAQTYSDVDESHWAYKQIETLTKFGIVVGYPDGNYRPEQYVTRGEFSSMVVRSFDQQNAELTSVANFSDVNENEWFYRWVQRAVMFDLLKGYPDGSFKPYGTVERGHVISTTVNSLTTETVSKEKAVSILESSYTDYKDIPDWLIIAAGKAEILGMIVQPPGEEGKVNAQRPATRAELAAFLVKMIEQAKLNPNDKLKAAMSPKLADGLIVDSTLNGYIATIPAGTIIPIMVLNKHISSQKSKVGEEFISKLPQNLITKERYLLLVQNDVMHGQITNVELARFIFNNGKVEMQTATITTHLDQTAKFCGICVADYQKLPFWKSLFRRIFKGAKYEIKNGDIVNLQLTRPVTIDLTNGWILE